MATATGGLAVLGLQEAGFGPGEVITLCSAVVWLGAVLLLAAKVIVKLGSKLPIRSAHVEAA